MLTVEKSMSYRFEWSAQGDKKYYFAIFVMNNICPPCPAPLATQEKKSGATHA